MDYQRCEKSPDLEGCRLFLSAHNTVMEGTNMTRNEALIRVFGHLGGLVGRLVIYAFDLLSSHVPWIIGILLIVNFFRTVWRYETDKDELKIYRKKVAESIAEILEMHNKGLTPPSHMEVFSPPKDVVRPYKTPCSRCLDVIFSSLAFPAQLFLCYSLTINQLSNFYGFWNQECSTEQIFSQRFFSCTIDVFLNFLLLGLFLLFFLGLAYVQYTYIRDVIELRVPLQNDEENIIGTKEKLAEGPKTTDNADQEWELLPQKN
ncbi:hypothetical protein NW762_002228 [Fusarium torreyae]|uniref:Uncharacterized protein n=1 Tax=Fusarium torreyae TaxID=1237075 RepID=A0A9W8SH26_9HYPO|nr:hypothetical protein NW762_002228 [Fusarium torreyae]